MFLLYIAASLELTLQRLPDLSARQHYAFGWYAQQYDPNPLLWMIRPWVSTGNISTIGSSHETMTLRNFYAKVPKNPVALKLQFLRATELFENGGCQPSGLGTEVLVELDILKSRPNAIRIEYRGGNYQMSEEEDEYQSIKLVPASPTVLVCRTSASSQYGGS